MGLGFRVLLKEPKTLFKSIQAPTSSPQSLYCNFHANPKTMLSGFRSSYVCTAGVEIRYKGSPFR